MAGRIRIGAVAGVLMIGALLWVTGCGMQLETGYQYRPLNASSVQRRAYYASPFTDEKTAAEQENKGDKGPALGPNAK